MDKSDFDSITILQEISPRVRREKIDWEERSEVFISLLSEMLNLSALVLYIVNIGELKSFSLNNYNQKRAAYWQNWVDCD